MAVLREDRRTLATQLRDRIWQAVQAGDYRAGEKLPSEGELAAQFGVSRTTVREALKVLEEERVILCRHGVGRFLASDPSDVLTEEITRLKSVTELVRSLGIVPTTRVLSMHEEVADATVCKRLELEPQSTVVVLERVRGARREPLIYSIDIFPRRLVVGELRAKDMAGSLITIMEEQWGLRLAYSKAVITAALLDRERSEAVGAPPDVLWVMLEQVAYDPQGRPILYSKDYHRADKIQFRVLRRRR